MLPRNFLAVGFLLAGVCASFAQAPAPAQPDPRAIDFGQECDIIAVASTLLEVARA